MKLLGSTIQAAMFLVGLSAMIAALFGIAWPIFEQAAKILNQ